MHMPKRVMILYAVLVGVTALILLIFGLPLMNGYLLGSAVAAFLLFRNVVFWSDVLDSRFASRSTGSSHFLVNYLLMVVAMLLSVKFPQYLNIFTCALGLLMTKITLVIDELWKGRSANDDTV